MKVSKIMHKGVATVRPSTSLGAIASMMRKLDVGAIPVKEGGQLVGMITDRDITCRGLGDGRNFGDLRARDVMTEKLVCCKEEDDVDDAIKKMRNKKIRRLAVVDIKGRLAGMLSLGDLSGSLKSRKSRQVLRAVASHHA